MEDKPLASRSLRPRYISPSPPLGFGPVSGKGQALRENGEGGRRMGSGVRRGLGGLAGRVHHVDVHSPVAIGVERDVPAVGRPSGE